MPSVETFFLPWAERYGYLAIFLVLLGAGLGVPIPEDIPLITGGWLAYRGRLDVWLVFGVSMVGVMVGDSLIFLAGRRAGGWMDRVPFLRRHVGGKRKAKVESYFARWGNLTVFFGRFVAGLRAPTFFTAGVSGMRFWTFFAYDCAAALVSVPVWIGLAYFFGKQIDVVISWMGTAKRSILIAIAVLVPLGLLWWWWRRRRRSVTPGPEEAGDPSPDEPPRRATPPPAP